MRGFRIARSSSETLTSHSGLALIGLALKRLKGFTKAVGTIPQRHGIATIDCIRSYVGLLCIGKSDFDAIENKRDDACPFRRSRSGVPTDRDQMSRAVWAGL